jgi:hypothetical protein
LYQQKVVEQSEENKKLKEDKQKRQEETTQLLIKKQRNLDDLTRTQRFLKRYEAELKGQWNVGIKTREELNQRMEKEKERKETLDTIIAKLREQFPFILSLT